MHGKLVPRVLKARRFTRLGDLVDRFQKRSQRRDLRSVAGDQNLGKEVRIPKADVDERRTSLLSPMPANFNETMKEVDFHHLMAYLLKQRAKP